MGQDQTKNQDQTKRIIHSTDVEGNKHGCTIDSLIFRPAAYGLVFRDSDLLVVDTKFGLSLPGGRIELGEHHEEALKREIFEETNVRAHVEMICSVDTSYWHDRGADYHCLSHFFRCEYADGELSTANLSEDERTRWDCKPFWIPTETAVERGFRLTADWRKAISIAIGQRIVITPRF